MDPRPSLELLEAHHVFPGVYQIKAIGSVESGFEKRLLDTVRAALSPPSEFEHSVRATPGGRHVAVTLKIPVENAEQVRDLYEKIQGLDGLQFLL